MKKIKILSVALFVLFLVGCAKESTKSDAIPKKYELKGVTMEFQKNIESSDDFKKSEIKIDKEDGKALFVSKYIKDTTVYGEYFNEQPKEGMKNGVGYYDLATKKLDDMKIYNSVQSRSPKYLSFEDKGTFILLDVYTKEVKKIKLPAEAESFAAKEGVSLTLVKNSDKFISFEFFSSNNEKSYTYLYNIESEKFEGPFKGGFFVEAGDDFVFFEKTKNGYAMLGKDGKTIANLDGMDVMDAIPDGFVKVLVPSEKKLVVYRVTEDKKLDELYSVKTDEEKTINEVNIYFQDISYDYLALTIRNRETGAQYIYDRKNDSFIEFKNEAKNKLKEIYPNNEGKLLVLSYDYKEGEGTIEKPFKEASFEKAEVLSK